MMILVRVGLKAGRGKEKNKPQNKQKTSKFWLQHLYDSICQNQPESHAEFQQPPSELSWSGAVGVDVKFLDS